MPSELLRMHTAFFQKEILLSVRKTLCGAFPLFSNTGMSANKIAQGLLRYSTNALCHHFSALEQQNRGNAHNLILRRQGLLFVYVNFRNVKAFAALADFVVSL